MDKSNRKFYFIALGVLLALSAYPVIMGTRIIILQMLNGSIRPEDYARYVIPYTAVCAAVLISVALYPVIARLRRMSKFVATVLGLGLFGGLELFMESITINSPIAQSAVKWQLASCIGTPAAVQAFQKPYSDVYKIHYFLISIVIIVLVIGIFYGYGSLTGRGDGSKKATLFIQLITVTVLLALCVFANFTGFFRDTKEYLSPLSAFLTGIFFIVLGVTFGVYVGSSQIGRNRALSVVLPTIAAVFVCSLMYYGEFKLLDGRLYRFGQSFFFEGITNIAVSPADIMVIMITGVTTAILMAVIKKQHIKGT